MNTVVEFWGGLHDGARRAQRGSRATLPETIDLEENAPAPDNKPGPPGKIRYTYKLDKKAQRALYRYQGCQRIEP